MRAGLLLHTVQGALLLRPDRRRRRLPVADDGAWRGAPAQAAGFCRRVEGDAGGRAGAAAANHRGLPHARWVWGTTRCRRPAPPPAPWRAAVLARPAHRLRPCNAACRRLLLTSSITRCRPPTTAWCWGPHSIKYSSCLYKSPYATLHEAETAMLGALRCMLRSTHCAMLCCDARCAAVYAAFHSALRAQAVTAPPRIPLRGSGSLQRPAPAAPRLPPPTCSHGAAAPLPVQSCAARVPSWPTGKLCWSWGAGGGRSACTWRQPTLGHASPPSATRVRRSSTSTHAPGEESSLFTLSPRQR